MANQVTLTFAGEEKPLSDSFDRVGGSAKKMGDQVHDSASGFDRVGEAADGAESKAQGFSDVLTGTADLGAGTAQILKGNLFEGFVTAGQGAADLAGGMASFLIPALAQTKIGVLAKAAADKVAAGAARVWAAAQWVMNSALFASPITWIVVAIVALIVVIVLIARRTDWFSKAWRVAWAWIKNAASHAWDFIKKIPGWISSAFSKVASYILSPFKSAFNGIAQAWNNTIGQLSWTVPSWIPHFGGQTVSVPHLPTFHAGGVVGGVPGTPTVALLQAGERVGSIASGGGGDGPVVVQVTLDGDVLIEALARKVDRRGGAPSQLGLRIA
jgi:hypothetical protein